MNSATLAWFSPFKNGSWTSSRGNVTCCRTSVAYALHGGASLHARPGLSASVPIAVQTKPIVDTMGAGDATLATVIAFILRQGVPGDAETWRPCLTEAMQIAAATSAHAGGGLMFPETPLKARG